MNELQIVSRALEQLNARTGIVGKWKPLDEKINGKLELNINEKTAHLFTAVKNELRQYQLPLLYELAVQRPHFMIVADRIFPTLKEVLRSKKIGYLDGAGNIYINTGDTFLWIDGQKAPEKEKTVTNRAFTKTGLKTVFYLLLHGEAINMPHRKLAEITGVSLGNIRNVIEGLKGAGFILQINEDTMQLQNKMALLNRWITSYGETLKPTLRVGSFRFWREENPKNWQTLPVDGDEIVWGGEPAADHYTNYLIPEVLTIYTRQPRGTFISKLKLIPDEKGNIKVYEKFWKDDVISKEQYAAPLLVYADLLLTGDPRCTETAEMIYTKYLEHEFGPYKKR